MILVGSIDFKSKDVERRYNQGIISATVIRALPLGPYGLREI